MANKKKDPALLAHLSKNECAYLDEAQGGMKVIPIDDEFSMRMASLGHPIELGQIRDYRPLAKYIKKPEFKEKVSEALTGAKQGNPPPEFEQIMQNHANNKMQEKHLPANDPALNKLEKKGREGDTEIVLMPLALCDFLDELRGHPQTNPETGFPEYFWGAVIGGAMALAGTLYGVNQMKKGHHQDMQMYAEEQAAQRKEREMLRQRFGLYRELPALQRLPDLQPLHSERADFKYKKGGALKKAFPMGNKADFVSLSEAFKGKGKGQADDIKKDLPENAYIINATAAAHLGDGNSDAGLHSLKSWEKGVQKGYKGPKIRRKSGIVKAKVSSKEYQISPLTVTLLGKGNNKAGAMHLDKAVGSLMLEKSKNGAKLPPKAKPFHHYFNQRSM